MQWTPDRQRGWCCGPLTTRRTRPGGSRCRNSRGPEGRLVRVAEDAGEDRYGGDPDCDGPGTNGSTSRDAAMPGRVAATEREREWQCLASLGNLGMVGECLLDELLSAEPVEAGAELNDQLGAVG